MSRAVFRPDAGAATTRRLRIDLASASACRDRSAVLSRPSLRIASGSISTTT
jgi:hypothetical protein